ncbi:MAG: hypothetical protein C0417_12130 [Chlorobiaceae bacterium]|nr:hypothetical protein [Chlorobiaceae bacterium]
MTRVSSVIIAIIIFSSQLFAQEDTTARKHSLYKGAWALQFGVSSYLSFQSFQSGQLSAKKQISDNSAIRANIGFNSSVTDENGIYDHLDYSINLSGQYIYYTAPHSVLKFYYGGGPSFNYFWEKTTDPSYTRRSYYKQYGFGIGALGMVGTEWFATASISFFGEYYTLINYSWSKTFSTQNSIDYIDKRGYFRIYPVNARFGISLYF